MQSPARSPFKVAKVNGPCTLQTTETRSQILPGTRKYSTSLSRRRSRAAIEFSDRSFCTENIMSHQLSENTIYFTESAVAVESSDADPRNSSPQKSKLRFPGRIPGTRRKDDSERGRPYEKNNERPRSLSASKASLLETLMEESVSLLEKDLLKKYKYKSSKNYIKSKTSWNLAINVLLFTVKIKKLVKLRKQLMYSTSPTRHVRKSLDISTAQRKSDEIPSAERKSIEAIKTLRRLRSHNRRSWLKFHVIRDSIFDFTELKELIDQSLDELAESRELLLDYTDSDTTLTSGSKSSSRPNSAVSSAGSSSSDDISKVCDASMEVEESNRNSLYVYLDTEKSDGITRNVKSILFSLDWSDEEDSTTVNPEKVNRYEVFRNMSIEDHENPHFELPRLSESTEIRTYALSFRKFSEYERPLCQRVRISLHMDYLYFVRPDVDKYIDEDYIICSYATEDKSTEEKSVGSQKIIPKPKFVPGQKFLPRKSPLAKTVKIYHHREDSTSSLSSQASYVRRKVPDEEEELFLRYSDLRETQTFQNIKFPQIASELREFEFGDPQETPIEFTGPVHSQKRHSHITILSYNSKSCPVNKEPTPSLNDDSISISPSTKTSRSTRWLNSLKAANPIDGASLTSIINNSKAAVSAISSFAQKKLKWHSKPSLNTKRAVTPMSIEEFTEENGIIATSESYRVSMDCNKSFTERRTATMYVPEAEGSRKSKFTFRKVR